jgi:hypothetical protein
MHGLDYSGTIRCPVSTITNLAVLQNAEEIPDRLNDSQVLKKDSAKRSQQ